MFGIDSAAKTGFDFVLVGVAGLALAGLLGLGCYGVFTGFLQTNNYLHANDWVALICGFIGAGCVLYLLLELTGRLNPRLAVFLCIFCGMFSVFAVTKGVPAAATTLSGKPAVVRFAITRYDWGGKGCPSTVVAVNPDYEDFRQCIKYFTGKRPDIGRTIEVSGMGSAWGIVKNRVEVR